ncbi:YegJ family protein [Pedobacter sp. GR22-6]|uniref:YegJ family protein n=1 Tax=Pedobacter sp. GR22-6 TaxID=3127957 RepID=UPI00307DF1E8
MAVGFIPRNKKEFSLRELSSIQYFTLFAILLCTVLLGCQNKSQTISRTGEPDIAQISGDDVAMNNAILTARKTITQFDSVLNSVNTSIDGVALKARFDTPTGDGEHIWLTDVKKIKGQYSGVIGNLPNSTQEVKIGDTVSISNDRISDWMYLQNGKLKGGFTIRVLRDQLSTEEKKAFDEENGIIVE